jgi:photosystem II stability/assembly factor-like uncharacterized protein
VQRLAICNRMPVLMTVGALVGLCVGLSPLAAVSSGASTEGPWDAHAPPGESFGIFCRTSIHCMTVGVSVSSGFPAISTSSTDGRSWRSAARLPQSRASTFHGVSCGSSTSCVVVGGTNAPESVAADYSNDEGRNWSIAQVPNLTAQSLSSVSCPSPSLCLAVGIYVSGVLISRNGGRTWQGQTTSPSSLGLVGLSCANSNFCIGLSGNHRAYVSRDQGRVWKKWGIKVPTSAFSIYCSSSNTCTAVGFDGSAHTLDGGLSWKLGKFAPSLPSSPNGLYGVTCISREQCLAVGLAGSRNQSILARSSDGGSKWSP